MIHSGQKIAVLPIFLLLTFAGPLPAQQDGGPVALLQPGEPVEREIEAGERHRYGLDMQEGEYVRLGVDQRGIDVLVEIRPPDGRVFYNRPQELDTRPGTAGREILSRAASDSGMYSISVRATGDSGASGVYEILVDELLDRDSYRARVESRVADPRAMWLRESMPEIRSIDPADTDFSDLEPLREYLADARVVVLGESTHGDGATYLAKTRLFEFLHQEMGFDVLAFESGLYGVEKSDRAIAAGVDPRKATDPSLLGWQITEEFQPLLAYVAASKESRNPVALAGFDVQFTEIPTQSWHYADSLPDDLIAYLEKIGVDSPATLPDAAFRRVLQKLVDHDYYHMGESGWEVTPPDSASRSAFHAGVEELQEAIRRARPADPREALFWVRVLQNAAWLEWNEYGQTRIPLGEAQPDHPDHIGRDAAMGRNLVWLADEYFPDRKIVGWAATAHAIRGIDEIEPRWPWDLFEPMGQTAWEALGEELYVIGFTSEAGTAGTDPPLSIPRDVSPSLEIEELLEASGWDYGFVDLRDPPPGGTWLRDRMISKVYGAHIGMEADWGRVLDGIFFIREQHPVHRIEPSSREADDAPS